MLGMRRAALLLGARMFPEAWQGALRQRAVAVIGAARSRSILDMGKALMSWNALDRLDGLRARVLLIAGERDYLPLAEKHALAKRVQARIVVIRGSRHGTPFDSVLATNAALLSWLTDQSLPPCQWLDCDEPIQTPDLTLTGTIAEEHATGLVRLTAIGPR